MARTRQPDEGIPCAHCGDCNTKVINSRAREQSIYRRRRCKCGHRFTTHEVIEGRALLPGNDHEVVQSFIKRISSDVLIDILRSRLKGN